MKVINRTKEMVTLEIVLANGAHDSVNIQPQGRIHLPAGAVLNPTKELVYNRIVKIIAVPETAPEATVSPSTTPHAVTDSANGNSVTVTTSTQ
jgi:hypothetical protein